MSDKVTKFTPGPWSESDYSTDEFHKQVEAFDEEGNRALCIRLSSFDPEADSSLVMAAPELYAACVPIDEIEEFVDHAVEDDFVMITVGTMRKIKAALAKARGETE